MKKDRSSVAAPGKVILLGEHSVVFGEPAIAATVERKLRVVVRKKGTVPISDVSLPLQPSAPLVGNGDCPLFSDHDARREAAIAAAARMFDLDTAAMSVEVSSDIPPGCGLGSSAALSLALVRALADLSGTALSESGTRERAAEIENVFHGTASGVDVATVATGGVLWFERGLPPRIVSLSVRVPFDLVVALSGDPRSTAGPVGRLRARHERNPELWGGLFRAAGDLVRSGRDALEQGDLETLGGLMDAAQGLLNGFGVSTPKLERMVAIARGAGAFGAKLTGGGGGGAIVALAPLSASAVAEALRAEGFEAFVTRIGSARSRENDDAPGRSREHA